ncbi:MAG: acetyl-CoA carboxylase biotin carboxylase subunit, partial [Planctomycetes bacterium]|nr:acetyl-CoA carboxylase biotin carboxylase subunit [Planctomycetota bacterium]
WQLRIASGEHLKMRQKDIRQQGVAIECRINAEDPANKFAPSPGRIEQFVAPGGYGVRLDSHVYPGYEISPYYDSLIGKLIVHKKTRAEAIGCMKRALDEFEIGPVKTTIGLCREILSHPQYIKGNVDTGFIERTW